VGSEWLDYTLEESENGMRLVWAALICGTMFMGGRASADAVLELSECRLDHPLRLNSTAARCGALTVAEDPAAPGGATIDLRIAVVPALNRRSTAAPVFLLAGGPGQAASDLYTSYAGAFARINRNHAIVLVDQRGTGRSAPLTCRYPEDWQDAADDLPQLLEATRTCLARLGERVRHYTTGVAVGDLEKVRIALGFARIDLYGSSYGTRVAQLYMRRYPQSTQAVILDGVTYPQQAIGPDTPADGERALNLILARCEQTPECTAAYPQLRHELDGLRRRFGPQSEPLALNDPGTGLPLRVEFNRSMLNAALRFLSYNSTEASLLPALIHQGAAGNLAPLASQTIMLSRQIGDQLAIGMQNSVVCSEDEPLFAASSADRRRIAETYQGSDQLDALAQICKLWPRGAVDPDLHAALQSEVPTLLLSGEADPVTPPDDAARAAQGLAHHRLLVLPGEGHGQVATACVPRLMAAFFDNPDTDALDARCLGQHRPAPFFVGLTGPAP
jgi:pimeloyl-ACP methyl ester carboxylesterase